VCVRGQCSLQQLHAAHTPAPTDAPATAKEKKGNEAGGAGYVKVLSKQLGAIWITVRS